MRIDKLFANSGNPTRSQTEKQLFSQGFGDINAAALTRKIALIGLLMILLLTTNVVARSVRERSAEFATLKTLGFPNGTIMGLVLAESLFLSMLGGGLALGTAWLLISSGSMNNAFLPVFVLRGRDLLIGVGLCCMLGTLAGSLPAASAMRLKITDALRRN